MYDHRRATTTLFHMLLLFAFIAIHLWCTKNVLCTLHVSRRKPHKFESADRESNSQKSRQLQIRITEEVIRIGFFLQYCKQIMQMSSSNYST